MYIYILELILIWLFGGLTFRTSFGRNLNKKKIFLWLSFSMMTIVLGCRGETTGEDTLHYVELFKKADTFYWIDIFTRLRVNWINEVPWPDTMETGFAFIAKFVHMFTNNAQWFLFVVALITSICFAKFIYDNCETNQQVFFGTYVYMCECMYMMEFNGARQMMAIAIGINSYTLIKKRKTLKAVILILFAALFHNTAIMFFLMIPFMALKKRHEKDNYKIFKYIFVGCLLIPLICPLVNIFFSYVFPRYSLYFSHNYWKVSLGGIAILWLVEFCLVLTLYKRKFKEKESFELSVLVMIYLMLELISFTYSAFNRVAWYYRAYLIVFFSVAVSGIKNPNIRKVVKIIIYALITIIFLKYANTDSRQYVFLLKGV